MAFGDSAGLLFRIKSEYDKTGVTQATTDVSGLEAATGSAGLSMSAMAGIALAAVAGIAAVGAAAVSAAESIFNLAKNASEFGSRLFDVQQKTGLTAATLGTLDIAAKQSGSSLEQVSASTAKFSKLIGQAAEGNEKAQQTLKQLGVTSNDLDTALNQVFHTINSAQAGVEQMTLAQQAFGKSGSELIPVIKQLDGDLQGSTERAKALGEVLSDEALKAADDFGDALADLRQQASVTAAKFGLEVAPIITQAMKDISKYIGDNQETITEWSQHAKTAFLAVSNGAYLLAVGVRDQFALINSAIDALSFHLVNGLAGAWNIVTLGAHNAFIEMAKATNAARLQGEGAKGFAGLFSTGGSTGTGARVGDIALPGLTGGGSGGGRGGGGGSAGRDDSERLERDRIQQVKASAQEEIQLEAAKNKVILERYKADLEDGNISAEQALKFRQTLEDDFLTFKLDVLRREFEAVQGNAKEEAAVNKEIQIINFELEEQQFKHRVETSQQLKKTEKERYDEAEKLMKREIELAGQRLDQLDEELKKNKEIADQLLATSITPPSDSPGAHGEGKTSTGNPFLDALFTGEGMDVFQSNAEIMQGVMTDLGGVISDVFNGMSQAVGSAIQSWVLYGGSIGKAMRQATAAVLAQIAAQAAVKAIYYTAEGIAALFFNPPAAAGFFTAAALMAGIAVGSALIGRAVAGDSFKKQTSAATGSSSTAKHDTSGQGAAYSGQQGIIQETGVNRPSPLNATITLNVRTNDSHIVEVIEKDTSNNGKLRGLIVNLANA